MNENLLDNPAYIFESSWEVCNKVGGIYTVLSTKAYTLQKLFPDRIIFIGAYRQEDIHDFIIDDNLFSDWKSWMWTHERMKVVAGRWDVPGQPIAILVDFRLMRKDINKLFYRMWEKFNVNSINGYGDYEESCMFAFAAGRTVENFYRFHKLDNQPVIAHFNEWTLGMGALYLRDVMPKIATIFTTHATSLGRSIAGNDKPLYSLMEICNPDQMAVELNMEAKHSLEKQTAAYVDCFTTVSEITSRECKFLLGKAPDVVTPNGFEQSFVPTGETFEKKRREARAMLIKIAERLLGCSIQPDAFIISTSGRYEYRNKGLDIFIDAMNCLRMSPEKMKNETIAFIMTPAWTIAPRADLQYIAEHSINQDEPLQIPFITHWIHEMENDRILNYIQQKGFSPEQAPKIIFIPCYLTGNDGLFNSSYYDLLPAMDMTVYPSYYEPWGYTPQESIAFGIPAVTTDLAGFGLWAESQGAGSNINQGVKIIRRTDENYFQAAEEIAQAIISLMSEKKSEREKISVRCRQLAQKTGWEQFISYYEQAYSIALRKASERMN